MTVKQKQNLLQYLGYYNDDIDGAWGNKSQKACEAFQKDYGLPVGQCTSVTEKGLIGAVSGSMVKVQQTTVSTATSTAQKVNTGTFWDDIKYFTKDEFKCKCGGKYCTGFPKEPSETLVRVADKVREHFGKPATVSSGLRDDTWNRIQGGVANSKHRLGTAMDFSIEGVSGAMLDAYVGTFPEVKYHYVISGGWVHMDV